MKKFLSMALVVCMLLSTLSLAGCGKKEEASATQLDIYILDAGYGTEWLNKVSEEFKAQDWVQEKYPDLSIKIDTNAESSYAEGKITAGANANPYDLLFGINLQTVYSKRDSNRNTLLLDISDVYDSEVPGEEVLVKEKMLESAIVANAYTDISGETAYYAVPWAGGFNGILYNADKLKDYGEVPVTTDELLAVMKKVTAKEGYSIMQSCENSGACYWEHLYPIWWAQYEGYDNYMSFWEGKVDGEYSVDIFKQQGRLESLQVLENVLGSANKNLYEGANATAFIDAQTNFLMGQGVFMANGDWFDREMSDIKEGLKGEGYDYDIRMMKTPVISSIINKTTTIPDDATLVYWDYYSKDKVHYDERIENYQKLQPVWFAGGTWTWTGFAPHLTYSRNISEVALQSCKEHGVKSYFTTMWGDDGGECSRFSVLPELYRLSQAARGVNDMDEVKSGFYKMFGIEYDDFMLAELTDTPNMDGDYFNPDKYMLYNDCFTGSLDSTVNGTEAARYAVCAEKLKKMCTVPTYGILFETLYRLCRLLEVKYELGTKTRKLYMEGEREELLELVPLYDKNIVRLEDFYKAYEKQWMWENKPHGFDVMDIRLGGLLKRLLHTKQRIIQYAKGEIDRIEELEEPVLEVNNWVFSEMYKTTFYNSWVQSATCNVITQPTY